MTIDLAPSHAVTCWIDDDGSIVVLIPSTRGAPFYQRYACTEGGLSKALNVLRSRQPAPKPRAKHGAGATATTLTPAERTQANAYALLKRRGMVR